MRGEALNALARARKLRITPAHAGRRYSRCRLLLCRRDHPRACGEKREFARFEPLNLGSPPRMRGEARAQTRAAAVNRITPAHAGRSLTGLRSLFVSRDHPRACGEKYIVQLYFDTDMGSPPRMRGEAGLAARHRAKSRITPAHAGRSFKQFIQSLFFQDHPRACGEK